MIIKSFNELVKLIGPAIAKENIQLRLSIPVEERLSVKILLDKPQKLLILFYYFIKVKTTKLSILKNK